MKVLQRLTSRQTISSGRFFETLYKIPFGGEFIVRCITRSLGRIMFHSPLLGFYRADTMSGIKEQLESLTHNVKIPISIIKEEEEELQFLVHQCPYRYCRPDQQGVCDAIMDIDRYLFRLCGVELIIQDATVFGAAECRILLRKI